MVTAITEYWHLVRKEAESFIGHSHLKADYEINIVLKGELEVTRGDSAFELKAGDMVLFSANMFHKNMVVSKGETESISIIFSLQEGVFPENFLRFYRLSRSNLAIVKILTEELGRSRMIKAPVPAARALLEALILRLDDDKHKNEALSNTQAVTYHNAVNFMNQNLNSALTIREIAHECGVCITALKDAFAKYAGIGVQSYFFDLKMERARELLLEGRTSREITEVLGFSSPSYFSQCFRRKNGCSVREYCKEKRT